MNVFSAEFIFTCIIVLILVFSLTAFIIAFINRSGDATLNQRHDMMWEVEGEEEDDTSEEEEE